MKRVPAIYLGVVLAVCSVLGGEFAVNTRTSDDQTYASIAMDGAGNFVVVWSSYRQDGDSGGIFGQRFGAAGEADGNEFGINSTTAGNQIEPAAAADEAGNFVVVWEGHEQDNEDIYGQRFDANGTALGGEFRVNDDASGRQLHPKVAMNKTGAFVVVWEDSRYWPMEYFEVMFKLYDANGTAVQRGNANLLSHCRYPDVAMDGDGDFTVVWMQDDIYHTSNIITARRYDSAGAAKGDPFEVSVNDFFSVAHPAVACDGTGHFVVAWDGNPGAADQDNILGRRYKFDGTALSDEFVVNTTLAGTQQIACVSMNSEREFVIVWDSETDTGSNQREILGQRYDELFNRLGDEFRANTYTFEDQKYPAVAMREDGRFVTVWQSYGQDGSEYGIFGQMGPVVGSADFNGDGFVNFIDYCILGQEWLEEGNPLAADLVDDNRVDGHDLGAFCEQWLLPCYQCNEVDISGDGRVDFGDYCRWADDWRGHGPLEGDITGDGTVDMVDLKALLFHWAGTCQ